MIKRTIIALSQKYFDYPGALFAFTVIVCSVIEYFTSWIMEKLFKIRWWDYSSRKFNVDGRICLSNSFLFGFAGLLIAYVLYPLLEKFFGLFSSSVLLLIALLFFIVFMTDLIITAITLINIRITIEDIENYNHKSTDHTELARAKALDRIKKNATLYNALLKAFPYLEGTNKDSFKQFKALLKGVKKTIVKTGKVINNTKDKVVNTTRNIKRKVSNKNSKENNNGNKQKYKQKNI